MQEALQLIPLFESRPLLDAVMLGVSDEVYLVDVASMKIVHVSESVTKNTSHNLIDLNKQGLLNVLGVDDTILQAHFNTFHQHTDFMRLIQDQIPTVGHIGHDHLRVKVMQSDKQSLFVIIKNVLTPNSANDNRANKGHFNQALSDSESRIAAIVSNTPGLVFQLQLDQNGEMLFVYLSEGCKALLGLNAEELKQDSTLFYAMMNARDQASLRKRIAQSAIKLSQLDWEGRVWINDWQDNKWVNLRAIPRVLSNGVVQWVGIMINITQSKNEKHEIEASRRALAELTEHMNQIKELERARIAREIHDDLGGNLTAIKIGLSSIIKRLSVGKAVSLEQAQQLEYIVDNTFEAVHKISSDLRPNILDLGIVAALEWQAKEFEKQTTITCELIANQSEVPVTSNQAVALFRICQEAMSNIKKHADATKVVVDIGVRSGEIVMMICDDGVGIESSDIYKVNSFGLRGMQERVAALNGTFDIDQLSGHGTVITIMLPIE